MASDRPSDLPGNLDAARARWLRLAGYGVWLIFIGAVGLPLVLSRHFHADEIQVAYNIALWGVHDLPSASNYANAYMVPLSWLIGGLETSAAMLAVLRLAFFAVFLLSLIAMAHLQPYFRGKGQRLLVLFAATLFFPLWHYGYEIRHDALIACGSVLLFGITQTHLRLPGTPRWPLVLAGVVSAGMQSCGSKAFMYWLPFSGMLLVAAATRAGEPWRRRWSIAGAYAAGFIGGFGLSLGLLAIDGKLGLYASRIREFFGGLETPYAFSPTRPLAEFAASSPFVFAAALIFLVLLAISAVKSRLRVPLSSAITAAYLLWTVAVLYLSPAPFSYNFVHIVPFVFLAALDAAARVRWADVGSGRIAAALVLAGSALLFARELGNEPYTSHTNETQLSYMAAAEALTDPERDTVLDGMGMVLSRRPPGDDWMQHSLLRADYRAGKRTSFRDFMADHPSPVVLTNYRWGWLTRKDLTFLEQHYFKLKRNFFVLGGALPGAQGSFAIRYPGRYLVRPRDSAAGAPGGILIDRTPAPPNGIVELAVGTHTFDATSATGGANANWVVHWIGPNADTLPELLPPSNGKPLFMTQRITYKKGK